MNLKIKELIFRQNNLVPQEKCKYFIDIFEKYSYKSINESSLKFSEVEKNYFKTDNYKCLNLSNFCEIKDIKKAADLASFYVSLMILNYVNFLKINISKAITDMSINKTSNIRILKYNKGEHIIDHVDINANIRASCTLNLNSDYTGGEFTFFSGKHIETFKRGDAMIFPAEPIWIHGTKPILSGTRYSISCFLES
jgi:hypothetical protein